MSDPEDYIEQGLEYSLQAEYRSAVKAYSEAIHLNPYAALAYYGRGYCHAAMKNYDAGVRDFIQGIQLDRRLLEEYAPYVSAAYRGRHHSFLQSEQYDLAIADMSEAIRLQPLSEKFPGYNWYLRGCCHFHKDAYDDAIADFDEALRLGYTGYQNCVAFARSSAEARKQGKEAPEPIHRHPGP